MSTLQINFDQCQHHDVYLICTQKESGFRKKEKKDANNSTIKQHKELEVT